MDKQSYVVERFPESKIVLYGVSMGGATILMASSLNLPKNVVGIISDSAYTSPKDIICKILKDRKLPLKLTYPLMYLTALVLGGFNMKGEGAIFSIQKTNIPILLIHGKNDTFVPYTMGEELKKVAKTCDNLYLFDNAEHALSYIADDKKYTKIVKEFLKDVLK